MADRWHVRRATRGDRYPRHCPPPESPIGEDAGLVGVTGRDCVSMPYQADAENRRVDASLGEARPALDAPIRTLVDLSLLRQRWSLLPAVPVIAEDRSAGIDHSWGDLDIRTFLRGEQSVGRFAAHSVLLAPGAGLRSHYHEDSHTYLLVVDGEVELGVGAVVDTVGRHSLGYVPPRTRQSFRNRSNAPASLMVVHSPAGAERAFAAAHEHWMSARDEDETSCHAILARHGIRFDDAPLANDELTDRSIPPLEFEFTGPGDLEKIRAEFLRRPAIPRLIRTERAEFDTALGGATRRKHLLTGDDTGGNAMLNLISGVPGFGADLHHQPTEEEFFFITGGLLELTCATETKVLRAGGFAFCPRNTTHGFRNRTDAESWFVTLNSPAGHERAMAAFRRLMEKGAAREEVYDLSVAGGFVFHQ
jgi:quercetin dioxygenase-like cupin family protein